MGSYVDSGHVAGRRVTLSSEGPFLLGLLLEPFKLQVRWRGSLKARKREDLLTLLAHNAAPFLQRLRTTHGEFSRDLSMRKTGEYKNMTGMYLVVTVLSSTKCFCSILLILPGIHTR